MGTRLVPVVPTTGASSPGRDSALTHSTHFAHASMRDHTHHAPVAACGPLYISLEMAPGYRFLVPCPTIPHTPQPTALGLLWPKVLSLVHSLLQILHSDWSTVSYWFVVKNSNFVRKFTYKPRRDIRDNALSVLNITSYWDIGLQLAETNGYMRRRLHASEGFVILKLIVEWKGYCNKAIVVPWGPLLCFDIAPTLLLQRARRMTHACTYVRMRVNQVTSCLH